MKTHPYKRYEASPDWKPLDRAISKLIKNGDLAEFTTRDHVVGFILQSLAQSRQQHRKRNGTNGHTSPTPSRLVSVPANGRH